MELNNKIQKEKETKTPAKKHSFSYSDDRLCVCGVKNLCNYDDKQVEIALFDSVFIAFGFGLSVEKVDLEAGVVEVAGKITMIKYQGGKSREGFFKRLIK